MTDPALTEEVKQAVRENLRGLDLMRMSLFELACVGASAALPLSAKADGIAALIKAWEALPGGQNYSPKTIECWLANDMKPAVDRLRALSAPQEPQP